MYETEQRHPGPKELLTPRLLALYVTILIYSFINRMVTTPLTTFGLAMGISGFGLGILQNFCEVTCMVGRPLAGCLMDNGNERLAKGLAFSFIALASLGFSATKNGVEYGIMRLIQGFATAYGSAIMSSLLPSEVPVYLLGTATSISSAMNSMGTAWAPMISQKLVMCYSYKIAYAVPAAVSILIAVLLLAWAWGAGEKGAYTKRKPKAEHRRMLLRGISPTILPVCTIGLFANVTKDVNDFYTIQLGVDRGIDVTTGIAAAGAVAVAVGILAGPLIDKYKPQKVLIPAFLALSCSNFVYAFANTTFLASIAAMLFRIGLGLYWPALLVECCYILPERKATAIATVYFFLDGVSMLNNILLGYLYDSVGADKMFFAVGCINLTAVVYYLLLRHFYLCRIEKQISTKEN